MSCLGQSRTPFRTSQRHLLPLRMAYNSMIIFCILIYGNGLDCVDIAGEPFRPFLFSVHISAIFYFLYCTLGRKIPPARFWGILAGRISVLEDCNPFFSFLGHLRH